MKNRQGSSIEKSFPAFTYARASEVLELVLVVIHLDGPHSVRKVPTLAPAGAVGIEEIVADLPARRAAWSNGELFDDPHDGFIVAPVHTLVLCDGCPPEHLEERRGHVLEVVVVGVEVVLLPVAGVDDQGRFCHDKLQMNHSVGSELF